MKVLKSALVGLAGASLLMAPAASAAPVRNAESANEANSLGGSWLAIIGVALVVALAAIAAFGDDDDKPTSP